MSVLPLRLFFLLIFALMVSACSSYNEPKLTPIFHTEIDQQDAKFFTLTLVGTNGLVTAETLGPTGDVNNKPAAKGDRQGKSGKGGKGSNEGKRGRKNRQTSVNTSSDLDVASKKREQLDLMLADYLQQQFEQHHYCRTGYFELERKLGKGLLSIKGECKESATEQDKARFINKK